MMHKLWKSGNLNRWHANDDWRLRESGDTVWAHVGRVCALHDMLFGDMLHRDYNAIQAAIWHDASEQELGDPPFNSPYARHPDRRKHEAEFNERHNLPTVTPLSVKLCDRLDAYLWMLDRAPDLQADQEWVDALANIEETARELGVIDEVVDLIGDAGGWVVRQTILAQPDAV